MKIEKLHEANELLRQIDNSEFYIEELTSDDRRPYKRYIGFEYSGIWEEEAEKAIDRAVCRFIVQLMNLNDKLEAV